MPRVSLSDTSSRPTEQLPELLTAHELAAALRVSVSTVRRLAARGEIPPPVRVGRSVRWRRGDIARLLSNRADTPLPT